MSDIKETTVYESLIDHKDVEAAPPTLSQFFEEPVEEFEEDETEWKKHWVGMPSFTQEANAPYMKVIVNFRTKEDYEEFAKLIDQNLSEKTKSLWYPKLERDQNSLKRWMEAE